VSFAHFGDVAYDSGAMIEAGSETTSAMLNNAIIGLLSNPSTITAAHEELDRVVGLDRTPNFDDEPNLPYMRAIIKVSPSVPHPSDWRAYLKLSKANFARNF